MAAIVKPTPLQVLAYLACSDDKINPRILLNTRIPFTGLDLAEVRKSTYHGHGLFAKTDINKNQLITFYPGDILIEDKGPKDAENRCNFEMFFGQSITDTQKDKIVNDEEYRFHLEDYRFNLSEVGLSIVGHPDLVNDPAYLAHICNDGAKSHNSSDRLIYERISYLKMNAALLSVNEIHVGLFALRPIKKGEEILVSYTYEYWASYHSK